MKDNLFTLSTQFPIKLDNYSTIKFSSMINKDLKNSLNYKEKVC